MRPPGGWRREMFRSLGRAVLAANIVVCCWSANAIAQAGRVYTAADYAQAERFLDYNVNPLVYHAVEKPRWLADGRFWYRDAGPRSEEHTSELQSLRHLVCRLLL